MGSPNRRCACLPTVQPTRFSWAPLPPSPLAQVGVESTGQPRHPTTSTAARLRLPHPRTCPEAHNESKINRSLAKTKLQPWLQFDQKRRPAASPGGPEARGDLDCPRRACHPAAAVSARSADAARRSFGLTLLPTLTAQLIALLSGKEEEPQVAAAAALGELVSKLGDRVLPGLVPILQKGLQV